MHGQLNIQILMKKKTIFFYKLLQKKFKRKKEKQKCINYKQKEHNMINAQNSP